MPREEDDSARERRCLVTGETGDPAGLLRFVIGPDGVVVPDIAGRLPGRGYWVRASRAAVEEARQRNVFAKAAARAGNAGAGTKGAKAPIVTPDDLGAQVETLLTRSCLNRLGLAKRAGLVVTGFEKVAEALAADANAVLVTACDGSADGRGKLTRPGRQVIGFFSREELSLALGRENVVHAALTPVGIGARFLAEADRLAGFRDRTIDQNKGHRPDKGDRYE